MRVRHAETSLDEHPVTPLELFFDLVFVFAITQVTSLLAHNPTWLGVLHGMLVLAAVWWAWGTYAWLTSALDVDEGGVRLAVLAATALMLCVGLSAIGMARLLLRWKRSRSTRDDTRRPRVAQPRIRLRLRGS